MKTAEEHFYTNLSNVAIVSDNYTQLYYIIEDQ